MLILKVKAINYIISFFQVVFQQSSLLAPLAVSAVLKITEEGKENSVDLNVRILNIINLYK